ncbi:MAG: hypothetical protein WD768_06000 [Phycisphaeraceae bacterium]
MRHFAPLVAFTLIISLACRDSTFAQADKKEPPTIQGLEAIRLLFRTGKVNEAERFIYVELWDDINHPEAIHILAQIMMRKNQRDAAATWYRLLLRLDDERPSVESGKLRSSAEKFLKFGERTHEKAASDYLAQAGGKFPGSDKVSDLWMTQVSADLHGLKALQAWSYIEGHPQVLRGDSMWIHTQKSQMHRSGMKLVDEVDERKGVLFAVPHAGRASDATGGAKEGPGDINRDAPKDAGPPTFTRVTYRYPGKGKMLRIGTKMWGSAFRLEVTAGGKKVFDQLIEGNAWSDLSIDLPAGLKKDDKITLDLVLPKETKHIHGVWLDYVEVFEN